MSGGGVSPNHVGKYHNSKKRWVQSKVAGMFPGTDRSVLQPLSALPSTSPSHLGLPDFSALASLYPSQMLPNPACPPHSGGGGVSSDSRQSKFSSAVRPRGFFLSRDRKLGSLNKRGAIARVVGGYKIKRSPLCSVRTHKPPW